MLQPSPGFRASRMVPYGIALAAALLGLVLTSRFLPLLPQGYFLFLYAAVVVSAWYGGIGPSLLTTAIIAIFAAYSILPAESSFDIGLTGALQLAIFGLVGLLTGGLAEARHRAERAAWARGEQLQITLASIGDAVMITDRHGAVTFMNPIAEALTGWNTAEVAGRPSTEIFRIVNADTHHTVESPITRVLREGIIVGLANHTLLIAKDGTERPIDDSGAPIRSPSGELSGVVLVFRDVTERQRLEQERTQLLAGEQAARADAESAQQRLALLTEALTTFTASLDYNTTIERVVSLIGDRIADWCTVYLVNPIEEQHWFTYAKTPETRTLLETIYERYAPDKNPLSVVSQVLRSGQSILIAEVTDDVYVARTTGDEHLELMRALHPRSYMVIPMRLHERTIGLIVCGFSASEPRYSQSDLRLAEELARRAAVAIENARLYAAEQQARAQAEAAVRVRDQFLSIAAHELRTPLTALLGNAQLLQRRMSRDGTIEPRNQQALQVIVNQAGRLNQMIRALLDVARLESGRLTIERAPLDLVTLLQRIITEGEQSLDGRVIELHSLLESLTIIGDALRLEQVFQNLLQNAIKYSEPTTPVIIEVSQTATTAQVAVIDQGMGIPQEALPKLFQRFFRARNVEERQMSGMGIGLYVVYEVVTLHGGTVSVESTEGVGSTFTVSFPLPQTS